jgi:hypothetical protein
VTADANGPVTTLGAGGVVYAALSQHGCAALTVAWRYRAREQANGSPVVSSSRKAGSFVLATAE